MSWIFIFPKERKRGESDIAHQLSPMEKTFRVEVIRSWKSGDRVEALRLIIQATIELGNSSEELYPAKVSSKN